MTALVFILGIAVGLVLREVIRLVLDALRIFGGDDDAWFDFTEEDFDDSRREGVEDARGEEGGRP